MLINNQSDEKIIQEAQARKEAEKKIKKEREKEETKAKHVCNKECMKDGKCAEMKKETKGKGKG